MINQLLAPVNRQQFVQRALPASQSAFKNFARQKCLAARLVSTQSISTDNRSKQNKKGGYERKPRVQYVKVDSQFSKANKFTYVMPEDPHGASERVSSILKNGSVDDAYEYIKALPLDLQSGVVWNHLIGHCAKLGKAKHAEQAYVEMRRRGMSPNDRTFTHMISVYSKSTTPNAIEKAEEWLKKMKNFDIKPSIIHFNNLLKVYNHAGHPLKTIQLLDGMSAKRISPDAFTYGIALRACSELQQPGQAAKEIKRIWQHIVYRLEDNALGQNNSRYLKIEDLNLKIDDKLVISFLTAIGRTSTKESDMLPGLEAVHRLYSLCPPQADAIIEKHQPFGGNRRYGFGLQPSVEALDAILRFCGKLKHYTLGKEYYELALQQYPRLKPDQYVTDAYKWIEKMIKRSPHKRAYNKRA
ncbi:hypothetical protein G6F56_003834 [Rhizopus delemar]|nr:hypothetical protein G6F56_003834 [Rhizopus delemar]